MTVSRERFEQGMTYDQYKAQMTRNRDEFEANERATEIGEPERAAFAKRFHVLVLTEDWCGDARDNFPVLGRLAKETGTLDVRVLLRDQNLDLMDQYLNRGEFRSIPVFIFLDEQFREIGHWIERPAAATERRDRERAEIHAADPRFGAPGDPIDALPEDVREELRSRLRASRDAMAPWARSEVLRELRELVRS